MVTTPGDPPIAGFIGGAPPRAGGRNWHIEAESGEDVVPVVIEEDGRGECWSGVLLQGGGGRAEGIDYAWEREAVSHGGDEGPVAFGEGDVRGCVYQEVHGVAQRPGSFEAV